MEALSRSVAAVLRFGAWGPRPEVPTGFKVGLISAELQLQLALLTDVWPGAVVLSPFAALGSLWFRIYSEPNAPKRDEGQDDMKEGFVVESKQSHSAGGSPPTLARRSYPKNPIGLISLFVFFTEVIATVTLGMLSHAQSPFVGPLVAFLIVFPSGVALLFFATLWFKREILYGPSDFESDSSFIGLIERVERVEVRQQAAQIDPRGAAESAIQIIGKLSIARDYEAAIGLGKAFLKVNRYETALEAFMVVRTLSHSTEIGLRLTSYVAYSLIGLRDYPGALAELRRLERDDRDRARRYWPALARAYVHFHAGELDAVEEWFSIAMVDPEAREFGSLAAKLYPEFQTRFGIHPPTRASSIATEGGTH